MSTSPDLPEGRALELPGRGTTFVRDVPGPAGAPTLLLLHGWTANSAVNWFGVFTPLSRHFRVVAIDQRGHGHGLIEAGAALARFDSHVWLPEVDVPCAVVLTELDQTVPPNRQLQMVDALRDVEVVPLRAGHDACAVRPVLFADAVVEATTSVVERIALSGGTAAATRS